MSTTRNFAPPELPWMMTGAELLTYMQTTYPGRPVVDESLKTVAAIMDEYNRIRKHYSEKNPLFVKHVHSFSARPEEKEALMSFAGEHESRLRAAQAALRDFDAAVVLWEVQWGASGIRDLLKQILEQAAADAQRFSESLQALRSSSGPLDTSVGESQGSKLAAPMPQKRARV